jgi:hypothetical protein
MTLAYIHDKNWYIFLNYLHNPYGKSGREMPPSGKIISKSIVYTNKHGKTSQTSQKKQRFRC